MQDQNVDYFDFGLSNLQYPAGDVFPLIHPPSLHLSFDIDLPLLSPPTTTPEPSATLSYLYLPSPQVPLVALVAPSVDRPASDLLSPELPSAGPPVTQPSAGARSTPLLAPKVPVLHPTREQIGNFFCPYTEGGRTCGEVNWNRSANKAIRRHIKKEHIKARSGSTVWKCLNPRCYQKGHAFARKDALLAHRKKKLQSKAPAARPGFHSTTRYHGRE